MLFQWIVLFINLWHDARLEHLGDAKGLDGAGTKQKDTV